MTGAQARAIRYALGLTQTQLGKRLGVGKFYISNMETNRMRVSVRIAEWLRDHEPTGDAP